MEENLRILDNWFASFENYKRLSLKEAQILYVQMEHEQDLMVKKELKDELILGTMYVVYDAIKKLKLFNISSLSFFIEDLIQSGCCLWLEFLFSSKFLSLTNYRSFFYQLKTKICSENFSYFEIFGISKDKFIDLMIKFIFLKKENENFSYTTFVEMFSNVPNASNFYLLFEEIYHVLEKAGLLNDNCLKRSKLHILFSFLVEKIYCSAYNFKDSSSSISRIKITMDDYIEKNLLIEPVKEIYEKMPHPSLRDKQMLADFCGLYGVRKSKKEMGEEWDVTPGLVDKAMKRERTRIKKDHLHNKELKKIYEEL